MILTTSGVFTMKLKQLGANMTELQFNDGNFLILISYETPVATYHVRDNVFTKTNKKWSVTTSKHIGKWLKQTALNYTGHLPNCNWNKVITVDQEVLMPFIEGLENSNYIENTK